MKARSSRARRAPLRLTTDDLHRGLLREPLVGVKVAASIIGVAAPNFSRYRDRLSPVEVEGTGAAYFRSEVEQLARTMAAERAKG